MRKKRFLSILLIGLFLAGRTVTTMADSENSVGQVVEHSNIKFTTLADYNPNDLYHPCETNEDGTFRICSSPYKNFVFKYCMEVTGVPSSSETNCVSTFVILSNNENITIDRIEKDLLSSEGSISNRPFIDYVIILIQ